MANLNYHLFRAGDISAMIGDDSNHGAGRDEYSGLWSLTSRHDVLGAFVPSFAGLIAGAHRKTRPAFRVLSEHSAELFRAADEQTPFDSRAVFTLRPPHYVDYEFTLTMRGVVDAARGMLLKPDPPQRVRFPDLEGAPMREMSWCCYMNCPEDGAIYLPHGGSWVRTLSPTHGKLCRFAPVGAARENFPLDELPRAGLPKPFHWDWSPQTFDRPCFFGRIRKMVLLFLFDQMKDLRIFMSPSGGGWSAIPGQTCPAWDWAWLVPADLPVGQSRRLRLRMVYKPFVSNEELEDEIARYARETG